MKSIYLFWPILLFYFSAFLACAQNENPCLDKIDYSNNDINEGIDLDALFEPPSTLEISAISSSWSSFNIQSDDITKIDSYALYPDRDIQIYEHTAENRKHYGAILLPKNYNKSKSFPIMIWAEGLNQENPMVNAQEGYGTGFGKTLPDHFIVIPSFRGQSLKTMNGIYCSDGFFGDAYDGATDDALRLMQVALDQFPTAIDTSHISIYGGSRGGTVALLAGIRDNRISKVVSQSGPSQFHHRHCHDRYGWQFRYQFLNEKKPMTALREKLLKCSPIYFIENIKADLLVVHGKNDPIVPLWNAQNIVDRLGSDNVETIFTEDGHFVRASGQVSKWIKE